MYNLVVLIGRLVADPELKYTPSGVAVCTFRIAVNRRFKNENGENETDYIDIVAWRQSAEFVANYLSKGRLVHIQGRLQTRSWVQQDGQKRNKTEVVADQVLGLDRRSESSEKPMQAENTNSYTPAESPMVEDDFSESEMNYDPFSDE
ncbi:MAG: single-stranded DNA-binding protein [Armatimonadota bacterium]